MIVLPTSALRKRATVTQTLDLDQMSETAKGAYAHWRTCICLIKLTFCCKVSVYSLHMTLFWMILVILGTKMAYKTSEEFPTVSLDITSLPCLSCLCDSHRCTSCHLLWLDKTTASGARHQVFRHTRQVECISRASCLSRAAWTYHSRKIGGGGGGGANNTMTKKKKKN